MSATVGVRELRQNLSKYLDRVKEGESLVVTERGKEVARLVPSGKPMTEYQRRLVEEYGATIAEGDLIEAIDNLPPLEKPFPPGTAEAWIEEDRSQRDW